MTAAWIGNGSLMPAAAMALQMVGGRPRSANVSSRGGPSARAPVRESRMFMGGLPSSYFVFNSANRQSTKPESARRTRDRPATLHAIGRSARMLPAATVQHVSGQVAAAVAETGDQRLGVRHQPALPVPPQRARTPSARRELDLHAAAGGRFTGLAACMPRRSGGIRSSVGDDVVGGQLRSEVPGDMVGQLAVAAAEQQRREDSRAVRSRGSSRRRRRGRGTGRSASDASWADLGRRDVVPHPVGLVDAVVRRARQLGRRAGDHVGRLLQRAAVVRHEPERAPQLAVLLDARQREELGESDVGHRSIVADVQRSLPRT